MYTQVSRGNVFTCTSVRAAILKNLKRLCDDLRGETVISKKGYRVLDIILFRYTLSAVPAVNSSGIAPRSAK